jgi:hypothetical protein
MGLGKTLAEIEAIDKDELFGWMAFYHYEPWGCAVEDQRFATGLDLTFAINSKPGTKHPQWFDRGERRADVEPTVEQTEENIRDFFMGKTIVAAPPPDEKPRKPRSDKGVKRGAKTKKSARSGFGKTGKPQTPS